MVHKDELIVMRSNRPADDALEKMKAECSFMRKMHKNKGTG
jgi:hypothetical protein